MSNYLDQLNESQKQAVINCEGPSMVLAGAGSGKTRVLTYRIAHLMNKGVDPFNILALTFTNKASKEMRERIEQIVGPEAKSIWMGTFHSIFARILRFEHDKIGYPSNFTIYDTIDAKNLIKAVVKELGLDDKIYKTGLVLNRISSAKNNLLTPTAYQANEQIKNEDKMMAKPRLGEIYARYQQKLFKSSAMDFDDLLFKTNILLKDHKDVLYKYQHLFKYILVDEYQDTNFSQYVIVKKLAAVHHNICVVGDDAQSIYSFRGADIENILSFQKDYPEAGVYKLEQNYRSSQVIVEAANSIIAKNKNQIQKKVWTSNDEGNKITITKTSTDNEEGSHVAKTVFDIKMNHQARNEEFAVLYRTNAQSRAIEEALRKNNIPYKIYGGLSFYQRKEIKDLLAYFRMCINPDDEEALKRVINFPARGIGKSSLDKVIVASNTHNVSSWEIISQLHNYQTGLGNAAQKRISEFVEMIQSFGNQVKNLNAFDMAQMIANTCGMLKEFYSDKTPEGISRYENIQELLNGVKQFALLEENKDENELPTQTLDKFMSDVALLTDADNETDDDINKVSLMTIHSSKGLEFNYVFVVGLEENLFPSQMATQSRVELEEERRLFYVAITRAKKIINISHAQTRFKYGNLNYSDPSRFLEEIDPNLIEVKKAQKFAYGRSQPYSNPSETKKRVIPSSKSSIIQPKSKGNFVKMDSVVKSNSTKNDLAGIAENSNVEHERFGKGVVVTIDGPPSNRKAVVEFEKHGKKQLLLKFAKLKLIQ